MIGSTFLRSVKIRSRLFVLLIVLIVANVGTSWYLLESMRGQKGSIELLRQSGASIRYAAEASVNIVGAVSNVYRVINAPQATWSLESMNIESLLQNAKLAFDGYGKSLSTDEEKEKYSATAEVFNRWFNAMTSISKMISEGASQSEVLEEMDKIYLDTNMLTGSINEAFAYAALDMDSTADAVAGAIDSATRSSITIVIAVAILALTFGFMLTRSISLPLKDMVDMVNLMADNLDLTMKIKNVGNDEIGDVLRAIEKLIGRFKDALNEVINASRKVTHSSEEFLTSTEEANRIMEGAKKEVDGAREEVAFFASAVEEISASSQEVAAGAQSAAKRSTDVAEQVERARQSAADGITAVKKAVTSSVEVSKSADNSVAVVSALSSRARQIQNFVEIIGQIADQTNLLALNAAIEAARAGEHGRGFAVVAEEVRKLAEQSNNAAEQITKLAETIVDDLEKVVVITQENASMTEHAKQEAGNAQKAIENIMHSLDVIAGAAQDMAAVAEEQAASAEEIASTVQNLSTRSSVLNKSVENLLYSIANVSDVISSVSEGSKALASLAANLEAQVRAFKIASEEEAKSDILAMGEGEN